MALHFVVYNYSHLSSKGERLYSYSSGKELPSWLRQTMQAQTSGSHWRIHTDKVRLQCTSMRDASLMRRACPTRAFHIVNVMMTDHSILACRSPSNLSAPHCRHDCLHNPLISYIDEVEGAWTIHSFHWQALVQT